MIRRRKVKTCVHCGKDFSDDTGYIWCKDCSTPYFIARSKKVHGEKYDYSLSIYKKNDEKLKIICPVHGVFEQIPNSHLNGRGCIDCVGKRKYTTSTFIKKAKSIHGDKYDYKEVKYVNNRTKVKIICTKHGTFFQNAGSHIRGAGCPDCGHTRKIHDNK